MLNTIIELNGSVRSQGRIIDVSGQVVPEAIVGIAVFIM